MTGAEAAPVSSVPVVVDLGVSDTDGADGVVWSLPHGGDLDANLVRLHPGGAIAEHVNDEVDVLVFVQSGSGELTVDGHRRPLRSDVLALIPQGASRAMSASTQGITYLSIHRRRAGLTITPSCRDPLRATPPRGPTSKATR